MFSFRAPALAALILAPVAAHAAADGDLSLQAGVASDYISKGISKTQGDPQIWGRAEYARGDAYVGTWASNVKIPQRSDAEVHFYAGYKPEAWGYDFDFIAFYKTYPGTLDGVDHDLVEFRGDVGRTIGPLNARLRVEWTPDNFGSSEEALWVEGRAAWKVARKTELSAAIGRREQEGGNDYTAWNVGVKRSLIDRLSADLRWYDTNGHDFGDNYDGRLVVALTASF